MSKLNSSKINFNEKDFLVEIEYDDNNSKDMQDEPEEIEPETDKIIEEAKDNAKIEADAIIEKAKKDAQDIISEAQKRADEIIEEGNISKNEILTNAQTEIEHSSQEAAKKGY